MLYGIKIPTNQSAKVKNHISTYYTKHVGFNRKTELLCAYCHDTATVTSHPRCASAFIYHQLNAEKLSRSERKSG